MKRQFENGILGYELELNSKNKLAPRAKLRLICPLEWNYVMRLIEMEGADEEFVLLNNIPTNEFLNLVYKGDKSLTEYKIKLVSNDGAVKTTYCINASEIKEFADECLRLLSPKSGG